MQCWHNASRCQHNTCTVALNQPWDIADVGGSAAYLMFWRHCTREEEVGDGGENQAARGDEQAHPPGPHPAGVTVSQLQFSSCIEEQSHPTSEPCFPACTRPWCNSATTHQYLNQFCSRPHRSAAQQSRAGNRWQARTQKQQTGWLWMTQQLWGWAAVHLL